MEEDKFPDDFQTYTGRTFSLQSQKNYFLIYALLGVSFFLVLTGFVVCLSKVATVSSELHKMHTDISKDPFGHDIHLFPCGPDTRQWEYSNGKCYYFSLKAVPWHQAKAECEKQLSQLAIIKNLAEQNFIQIHTRNERFWIGLHDQHAEGEWKWLDGSDYTTGFMNWKTGEPNSYRGSDEDCGQLWVNGEWNDFTCRSNSYYVCEKPLPKKPTAAPKRT